MVYSNEEDGYILESYSTWISGNQASIPCIPMFKKTHGIFDLKYSHFQSTKKNQIRTKLG